MLPRILLAALLIGLGLVVAVSYLEDLRDVIRLVKKLFRRSGGSEKGPEGPSRE